MQSIQRGYTVCCEFRFVRRGCPRLRLDYSGTLSRLLLSVSLTCRDSKVADSTQMLPWRFRAIAAAQADRLSLPSGSDLGRRPGAIEGDRQNSYITRANAVLHDETADLSAIKNDAEIVALKLLPSTLRASIGGADKCPEMPATRPPHRGLPGDEQLPAWVGLQLKGQQEDKAHDFGAQ